MFDSAIADDTSPHVYNSLLVSQSPSPSPASTTDALDAELDQISAALTPRLSEKARFSILAVHKWILQQPVSPEGNRTIRRDLLRADANLHKKRGTDVKITIINSREGILTKNTELVNKDHVLGERTIDSKYSAADLQLTEDEFKWLVIPGSANPWLQTNSRSDGRKMTKRKRNNTDNGDVGNGNNGATSVNHSTRNKRIRRRYSYEEHDTGSEYEAEDELAPVRVTNPSSSNTIHSSNRVVRRPVSISNRIRNNNDNNNNHNNHNYNDTTASASNALTDQQSAADSFEDNNLPYYDHINGVVTNYNVFPSLDFNNYDIYNLSGNTVNDTLTVGNNPMQNSDEAHSSSTSMASSAFPTLPGLNVQYGLHNSTMNSTTDDSDKEINTILTSSPSIHSPNMNNFSTNTTPITNVLKMFLPSPVQYESWYNQIVICGQQQQQQQPAIPLFLNAVLATNSTVSHQNNPSHLLQTPCTPEFKPYNQGNNTTTNSHNNNIDTPTVQQMESNNITNDNDTLTNTISPSQLFHPEYTSIVQNGATPLNAQSSIIAEKEMNNNKKNRKSPSHPFWQYFTNTLPNTVFTTPSHDINATTENDHIVDELVNTDNVTTNTNGESVASNDNGMLSPSISFLEDLLLLYPEQDALAPETIELDGCISDKYRHGQQ